MFSSQLQLSMFTIIKALALINALGAAAVAWQAAQLWLEASRIEMPPFDPPKASASDAPELHVLSAMVQLNETADAIRQSATLNALAARKTALAAILTGAAAVLGSL